MIKRPQKFRRGATAQVFYRTEDVDRFISDETTLEAEALELAEAVNRGDYLEANTKARAILEKGER